MIAEHFDHLQDPRRAQGRVHRLDHVLTIALCAVVTGSDGWDDIAIFAQAWELWLTERLEPERGVPSAAASRRPTPSGASSRPSHRRPSSAASLWQDAADDSFWHMVARLDGTEPALAVAGYAFETAGAPVLTEVRAMELLEGGIDPEAGVVETSGAVQVVFDGTAHNVLPFAAVFSDVVTLVRENELYR